MCNLPSYLGFLQIKSFGKASKLEERNTTFETPYYGSLCLEGA
jgi:hypothetical protein